MNFRGTRPLPSKIACDFRRQRSVSYDSEGIGGNPPPAVENRKRFSTAGEGPFFRYFPRLLRSRRKSVLFLSEKGPSSAVKNRKRFSTADGEKKNRRFFFFRKKGEWKEKSKIFSSHRNRRNGRPLRFLWNLRGPRNLMDFLFAVCRRKSLAIFDGRRAFSPRHVWLEGKPVFLMPFLPIRGKKDRRGEPDLRSGSPH